MRREVWNMLGGFRLTILLLGSLAFVWCVLFNQGRCVFIPYNLLNGCWECILIHPWIQVRDYSLSALTCRIKLWIGFFRLLISAIVVLDRFYVSHCFYFSVMFMFVVIFWDWLLVYLCFCLFSCLVTVVVATNNLF